MLTVDRIRIEPVSRRVRRPGRDQRPLGCPAAEASPVGRTEPTGGQGDRAVWGSQSSQPGARAGLGRPRASSVNVSSSTSASGPGRSRSCHAAIATRTALSAVAAASIG
jgi:hypothetical protein